MHNLILPHDSDRLGKALSSATGVLFIPQETLAISLHPASSEANALTRKLNRLEVPAVATDNKVSVSFSQLQQAIIKSGLDETRFFAMLAEGIKNAAQENEQPVETQNGQPSNPPERERNHKTEVELVALQEGLEENKIAVKFRESLLQRIELQERFEPGFDKTRALEEANKLIKAVNKSYNITVLSTKKRNIVAAARIEKHAGNRNVELQEMERARAEAAALIREKIIQSSAMGNSDTTWQGAAPGIPAIEIQPLRQPLVRQGFLPDTMELNPLAMQDAISAMMEKLNLRDPSGQQPLSQQNVFVAPPFFISQRPDLAQLAM